MKAVACTGGELAVVDRPELAPGRGQLMLDVTRCGICGSTCTPGRTRTTWRG